MNIFTSIRKRPALTLCATLSILIGVGCASGPPEALKQQLIGTDTSIGQAEQAGAAQAALPELQKAKDKRGKAQEAMNAKKYDEAMRLAQQAQLDAAYAAQKSEARQADKTAAEVEKATDALERETERNNVQSEKSEIESRQLSEDR
jgi:hypothetical protein